MAYELGIKDACHKCQNYDTCKAPCAFVAAISDGDIVVNYAKWHNTLKNYRDIPQIMESSFNGKDVTASSLKAGDDDNFKFIENIPTEDACIEDTIDRREELGIESKSLNIFMDALIHGKDFKRIGNNYDMGEESARILYEKCINKLAHLFNIYERYKKPLEGLAEYAIPKKMKYYIASQLFEDMPPQEICKALDVTMAEYQTQKVHIEEQVALGDIVYYYNEDKKLVPATVSSYLSWLKKNPVHKVDAETATKNRRSVLRERLQEAVALVAGGMPKVEAARAVGINREYLYAATA